MTLKIYIGFLILHLALTMGEMVALSAANEADVSFSTNCDDAVSLEEAAAPLEFTAARPEVTRCIGAIWRFVAAVETVVTGGEGATNFIQRIGGSIAGVGAVFAALAGLFTFADYDTIFDEAFGGFSVIRMVLQAVGIGVLFLLFWRIVPALIASVGQAVGGIVNIVSRLAGFGSG